MMHGQKNIKLWVNVFDAALKVSVLFM